jgi:tungstate transport system ATP-binding protein
VLLDQSVWENVTYGLRLRGLKDSTDLTRTVLEQVGLIHLASQHARTLSGGEAQRVALARAMVLQPDVLLLDEPTANLDPYNVGLIEDIVRQLNQDRGTTLVLVTHNVFQARRLAGRVALLLEGQLVEVSGVEEFFQSPKDPRTAAFIRGEMVY